MGNRERIEKIISESLNKQASQQKEFYLFGKLMYLQEPFLGDVNVQSVIDSLEAKIPAHLFGEIDTIMIGTFDFLEERELEAVYQDGAIYVSSRISTDRDLLENLIHETSHSLEVPLGRFIYGDFKIVREFVAKRATLERILIANGHNTAGLNFEECEYDEEFDAYLYKELGYSLLQELTTGLFHTPYAVTSLREYWASGFEDYFLNSREDLKDVSPQLFNKIEGVVTYDD
jgi:hypothetical protein